MQEEIQGLLTAPPTSAGAFRGGQIPLGFDPAAIYQYQQGIQKPGAPPQVQEPTPQQEPASAPVQQAFDVPVYTQNWDKPIPPIVVRFQEGFNPEDPRHIAAEQKAYAEAYDEEKQGTYALQLLNELRSKEQTIKSASEAVAKYSQDVQRLEAKKQRGVVELPTEDGMVRLPMDAKSSAENLQKLGEAKRRLKTAEQELTKAKEQAQPKVINVELPAAQPPQQPQETEAQAQQETLPEAKPEAPEASRQRQRYDAIKNNLYQQAQQMIQKGLDPKSVQDGFKQAIERLDSQWKPELLEVDGVLYSYNTPSKPEIVRDNIKLVEKPFNDMIERVRKNIENIDQIESMRQQAERAAKLKGPERTAIIEALRASLKSINTAISGTSDALSQNEYLRLGGSLETWNFIKAMQPDSAALFFTANPEGFAKSVEVLRNMTGNRMVSNFNQAEKISKKFPVLQTLLPDKPSYYNEILKTHGKSQVIEKNRPQQQQAQPVITKQGTQFTRVPR
jgi:hypothetical protein